ncbi:MAG: hypothetical protein HW386_1220, partial [Gammaproteobacteria bacterium]|nr:hypothetical protein [Gammaproteobacteria bacterium]
MNSDMSHKMQKILLVFIFALLTAACSIPSLDNVLSDERTEYKKSEPLPPLELPPDLTKAEADEAMSIPGEATYKTYKNQSREPQTVPAQEPITPEIATTTNTTTTITPAPASPATATATQAPNVVVAAHGDKQELWNRLRVFMTGKGFQLDL